MYVARDLMNSAVITVAPHATLEEATDLLLDHGISGLPVVDLAGRVVGMFSELDEGKPVRELLTILCGTEILDLGGRNIGNIAGYDQVRAQVLDFDVQRVSDYMTTDVVVVSDNDPVTRVVDLFVNHGVHRLPVIRGHQLVGIIGVRDVVKFIRELKSKLSVPLTPRC